ARAGAGRLEQAGLRRLRVRIGAALVAEELGLEERRGNRSAIDLDERPGTPLALVVDGAGDHFLAHARLPADQHRGGRPAVGALQSGHSLDLLLQDLDRRGLADDVGDAAAAAIAGLEGAELLPR